MIVWFASYPRSGNTLLRTVLKRCLDLDSFADEPVHVESPLRTDNTLIGNLELQEPWPQFYARAIKSVDAVSLLEFGTPEAMWHLTVEDCPAIVTMDAHGNSLHKDIEQESAQHLAVIGV